MYLEKFTKNGYYFLSEETFNITYCQLMEKFELYRACGLLFPMTCTFFMFHRISPSVRELDLPPWES